jgi:hypothetical protein
VFGNILQISRNLLPAFRNIADLRNPLQISRTVSLIVFHTFRTIPLPYRDVRQENQTS